MISDDVMHQSSIINQSIRTTDEMNLQERDYCLLKQVDKTICSNTIILLRNNLPDESVFKSLQETYHEYYRIHIN